MNRICRSMLASFWLVLALAAAQGELPENVARIHYQRPDGAYEGFELHVWEDTLEEVTWQDGLDISGTDDYGVYWDVRLAEGADRLGLIVHKGDEKDPGPDQFIDPAQTPEIWLQSGNEQIFSAPPVGPPEEGTARIHYYRPEGDYQGFELHVWEDTTETVTWEDGLDIAGQDGFGVYWNVTLADAAETLGFIIHRGEEKDPGPDQFLDLSTGNEAWIVSGSETIHTTQPDILSAPAGDLSQSKAYWLRPDLIAWPVGTVVAGSSFALHSSPNAGLELSESEKLLLRYDERELSEEVLEQFPHLAGASALRLNQLDAAHAAELLRGQLAVSLTVGGAVLDATGLQIAPVLDSLYAEAAVGEPLGVVWEGETPTLALWAPTAQNVRLHLFETADDSEVSIFDMAYDGLSGIWRVSGQPDWNGHYYLYEVTVYAPSTGVVETNLVTDPYSLSLSRNSTRSQIVNLDDKSLKPEGWDRLEKPTLDAFEDIVLYELHLRDFSVNDGSVSAEHQGTYLAFTDPVTNGMKHLSRLADAGLTHLHLLPTFDIATIDEDKSLWQEPGDLSQYPSDSSEQQAAIEPIRDQDAFNWGYDPYHYSVPEGSYATDPEGAARILEYREMVRSLNELGLRFVMDVVYNHTNSSGQDEKSVLDRVVPGYYHRLNASGAVEESTCCQNTATEHAMMEKLMMDSVLTWATQYKVDGFRFDLMGHHSLQNMMNLRLALNGLTLEEDGVDGAKIYLYGEGWDFGEVAQNARFVNASQRNLSGSGIGSFNDRLRDAVRGGGPFDDGPNLVINQGFISGLYTAPNEAVFGGMDELKDKLLHAADLIRVGLAGNLADYPLINAAGDTVTGREVDYNGSPAGYTDDPQENIVYVGKHDGQTLWDIAQYKHPRDLGMAARVRAHLVGLSFPMFSQGVPFFQAGSELLRSKSFDRNSYNSGDWFNRLDFSAQSNNFGVGLPSALENEQNWQFMRPLLADPALKPAPADIESARDGFETMLAIRQGSPLFRLRTADEVQARLSFLNTGPEQVPGVIVMLLDDRTGDDLDPENEAVLVVFNATHERQTFAAPELEGMGLRLHPLQREGGDELVKTSAFYESTSELSVPGFTTAVFVAPQNYEARFCRPPRFGERGGSSQERNQLPSGRSTAGTGATRFPLATL